MQTGGIPVADYGQESMKGTHASSRGKRPPWKRPGHLLWFLLAILAAGWLTLHMPAPQGSRSSSGSVSATAARSLHSISPQPSTDQRFSAEQKSDRGQSSSQLAPGKNSLSSAEKILARLKTFGRLFSIVGLAAFLGGIIEGRRWYMHLARCMGRLTRMARLPEIVGVAMPTALCSNAAANSMLVASHAEGMIRNSALIAGGMINSYLAYISHSVRVMYPVIGAIGLPGLLYFSVQFTGGFLVILGVLLWNRHHVSRLESQTGKLDSHTPCVPYDESPILPWKQVFQKAALRAAALLFRMTCLTVPIMLGMEWLLKSGALDFWDHHVPEQITRFFPSELLSIVAAQMGGLVQSAAVSANLHAQGLVDNAQILLAMLVASAVGNPIRTLRRNLPSALGIFRPSTALIIVSGMQLSRLLTTLMATILVILFMHSFLY